MIYNRACANALETRKNAGIGPVAPVDIWKLLQESQISLIKEPLNSEISGLFIRKEKVNIILVNTKNTLGHQNFTAAHEYYHLKFNPELKTRVCTAAQFNTRNVLEQEADYFAAYLLAPDEAINFFLGKRFNWIHKKLSLSNVIAVEQYFGISHHAMLIRLLQTGWIDEQAAEQYRENVVRNAKELGYNTDLYRPTFEKKVTSDYVEKAKLALDRNLITKGKYEELLLEAGFGDLIFGVEEDEDAENIPCYPLCF